jgi:hypothetical protein
LFDDMIDWAVRKPFIVSIFIIEAKFLSMLHADKKLCRFTFLRYEYDLIQLNVVSMLLNWVNERGTISF